MMEPASRILYVDDEPVLLEVCRHFLEVSEGFRVETAISAKEGLDLLRRFRFDAIISDYQMPEMDGIGFLRTVRSDPAMSEIPFILFTGRGREEVVIEAINNRVDFYLQKGGDPRSQFAELSHKVQWAIEHRKREQALRNTGVRPVSVDGDRIQMAAGCVAASSPWTARPKSEDNNQILSHEFYQSFIEASPDVIILTDLTGKVIFASPRARKMFAIPSEIEVAGREIISWIAPEFRRQAFECISCHMQGEQRPPDIYRLLRSDGSSFPAEIHSAPVHGKGGDITGIIAIIRDNSERTAQHDALERANTKLNLLSSITRHDILNKITALRLYCSLIEEEEDPAENRAMLRKVEEMASIISDLVAFTSYYQNLGINTAQWITPSDVVCKLVDMIEIERVRIINGFGQVRILADPLFEKVLYNLFDNAIKYGETITTMRTGFETTENGLVLFISDDGIGVPEDQKEKIFERNVGHGTGLGLFLSREILSVTNLSIRERGIPGEGARFEILVPPDKYQLPE